MAIEWLQTGINGYFRAFFDHCFFALRALLTIWWALVRASAPLRCDSFPAVFSASGSFDLEISSRLDIPSSLRNVSSDDPMCLFRFVMVNPFPSAIDECGDRGAPIPCPSSALFSRPLPLRFALSKPHNAVRSPLLCCLLP
jgi:hypothetical protein